MNNIDWKAFETNMSLMLINMKLESLPTDLEKLVDKSYELADNAEKDLKKESEKTFADIEKMPEVIEETSDGEPILLPGVDEKLALVFSTNGNKVKKLDGIVKKLTKSDPNGIFLFPALFWYRLTSIIQFRNSKPTLVNGLYKLYTEKINE